MITLPKVKLEKVCINKNGMKALQDPWFTPNVSIDKHGNTEDTPGQGTLAASNGFVLAVLPVTHDKHDTAGPIPNTMIKAAHKIAKKAPATLATTEIEDRYDGHPPNIEAIIEMRHTKNLVSISIDAELLFNLADALCERKSIRSKPQHFVRLTFSRSILGPVLVEPRTEDSSGFGILMPIHDRKE